MSGVPEGLTRSGERATVSRPQDDSPRGYGLLKKAVEEQRGLRTSQDREVGFEPGSEMTHFRLQSSFRWLCGENMGGLKSEIRKVPALSGVRGQAGPVGAGEGWGRACLECKPKGLPDGFKVCCPLTHPPGVARVPRVRQGDRTRPPEQNSVKN